MRENIYAYTAPGADYPGFVSFNRDDAGNVEVTVRAAPTKVDGIRVCGQTCTPGDAFCNNYCNHDTSRPMPASPEPHTFFRAGVTASFEVPAADWEKRNAAG